MGGRWVRWMGGIAPSDRPLLEYIEDRLAGQIDVEIAPRDMYYDPMRLSKSSPPWWRVVAAFALTPLIAAFAFACFQPLYAGLPSLPDRILRTTLAYVVFGDYPAALVFGVPAFLVLRNKLRLSAINCAVTGAVVASFPWLLLGLFANPDYAYSNGHVTHENGAKTWWGWIDLFYFVGEIAALGALAGLVFCAIAAAGISRRG